MVDVHDRRTRSRNMAAIRSTDTRPEKTLRTELFRAGLRYRLHVSDLPGRPDLVFARHKAVVFVHGCFFHAHDCRYFKWPATNVAFWKTKIEGNRARDVRNVEALRAEGWRIFVVWECELRQKEREKRIRALAAAIRRPVRN
jgi:DNA mismatch endonuclease, patch repair protein